MNGPPWPRAVITTLGGRDIAECGVWSGVLRQLWRRVALIRATPSQSSCRAVAGAITQTAPKVARLRTRRPTTTRHRPSAEMSSGGRGRSPHGAPLGDGRAGRADQRAGLASPRPPIPGSSVRRRRRRPPPSAASARVPGRRAAMNVCRRPPSRVRRRADVPPAVVSRSMMTEAPGPVRGTRGACRRKLGPLPAASAQPTEESRLAPRIVNRSMRRARSRTRGCHARSGPPAPVGPWQSPRRRADRDS